MHRFTIESSNRRVDQCLAIDLGHFLVVGKFSGPPEFPFQRVCHEALIFLQSCNTKFGNRKPDFKALHSHICITLLIPVLKSTFSSQRTAWNKSVVRMSTWLYSPPPPPPQLSSNESWVELCNRSGFSLLTLWLGYCSLLFRTHNRWIQK